MRVSVYEGVMGVYLYILKAGLRAFDLTPHPPPWLESRIFGI